MRYLDPDGREVNDEKTKNLLNNIFNNELNSPLPENIKKIVSEDLVQGRNNEYIKDMEYIGDSIEKKERAVSDLLEAAESRDLLVSSKEWFNEDSLTDVTEFFIWTYDSETQEAGDIYNIYIDIGNEGNLDYVEWEAKDE